MKLALLALFALSTTLLPLAMAAEQVKDTSGNPIFPGGRFYVMPAAIFGPGGGGLKFSVTGSQFCPVTVLQDYSEVERGVPVMFSIKQDIGPGMIFTGTPLDISFIFTPTCAGDPRWVAIDDSEGAAFVGLGSSFNHPGKRIIDGVFKIEKAGGLDFYYRLVFCPTATAPPGLCYDIGKRNDRYGWRLVLLRGGEEEEDVFRVVFLNAGDDNGNNGRYSIIA